jgi:hypothetical protein
LGYSTSKYEKLGNVPVLSANRAYAGSDYSCGVVFRAFKWGSDLAFLSRQWVFNLLLGLSVCLVARLSFISKAGATHRC